MVAYTLERLYFELNYLCKYGPLVLHKQTGKCMLGLGLAPTILLS